MEQKTQTLGTSAGTQDIESLRRQGWQVKALTGNQAGAHAARLSRIQAGLFFPIGPADEIMETVALLIRRGDMPPIEIHQLNEEGSTISAQVMLAQQGIRTLFTTSAEGLWWGGIQIHSAASLRLPMMITCCTRAPGPPRTVGCDHQDIFGQRDSGCLIFMCEDGQDVIDTMIQAYRVSEDRSVLLPTIVAWDGWEVSHSTSRCLLPPQELVDSFLPRHPLDQKFDMLARDWHEWHQVRRYSIGSADTYMENKYLMQQAHERSKGVVEKVGREWRELTGSSYGGMVETYRMEDAEVAIVAIGGMVATTRFVANVYRERGHRVGVVKLKTIRPFPEEQLAELLSPVKVVVTLERVPHNPFYTEVRAALSDCNPKPLLMGRIVGIGGRDVSYEWIAKIVEEGLQAAATGKIERKLDWLPILGRE